MWRDSHGLADQVQDLIRRDGERRDGERMEQQAFDRLKAELGHAFAVPDSSYVPLTAAEVIARNRT